MIEVEQLIRENILGFIISRKKIAKESLEMEGRLVTVLTLEEYILVAFVKAQKPFCVTHNIFN